MWRFWSISNRHVGHIRLHKYIRVGALLLANNYFVRARALVRQDPFDYLCIADAQYLIRSNVISGATQMNWQTRRFPKFVKFIQPTRIHRARHIEAIAMDRLCRICNGQHRTICIQPIGRIRLVIDGSMNWITDTRV